MALQAAVPTPSNCKYQDNSDRGLHSGWQAAGVPYTHRTIGPPTRGIRCIALSGQQCPHEVQARVCAAAWSDTAEDLPQLAAE